MAKKNTKNILSTETAADSLPTVFNTQLNNSLPTEMVVSPDESSTIVSACKKAGIGIDDYVKAIKDALSATKMVVDKFGEQHVDEDHAMRLKAALMGLELEGYIKAKGVAGSTGNSTYNTVVYQWKQPSQVTVDVKN